MHCLLHGLCLAKGGGFFFDCELAFAKQLGLKNCVENLAVLPENAMQIHQISITSGF